MNILEILTSTVFVFGWYPVLWLIWLAIMLAGFEEDPLEHNMMTAREIVSNNLGCFLVGSLSRFVVILVLYPAGISLYLLVNPEAAFVVTFAILLIGVLVNPGQIFESDGFDQPEI